MLCLDVLKQEDHDKESYYCHVYINIAVVYFGHPMWFVLNSPNSLQGRVEINWNLNAKTIIFSNGFSR